MRSAFLQPPSCGQPLRPPFIVGSNLTAPGRPFPDGSRDRIVDQIRHIPSADSRRGVNL